MDFFEATNESNEVGGRFKYNLPWELYCLDFKPNKSYFALGSYTEEYCNKIDVTHFDPKLNEFSNIITFNHPYPPTKLLWIPDKANLYPNLLASSGDYLRIWNIDEDKRVKMESLLNTNKESDFCAPITSFDWNEFDVNLIGTASIDTTCTIWSLETNQSIGQTSQNSNTVQHSQTFTDFYTNKNNNTEPDSQSGPVEIQSSIKTQLIAHDKEVFDIAFSAYAGGKDMFATTGADSSVRIFDLRHLEHSTIIYEHTDNVPLVRIAWNKREHSYLAILPSGSKELILVDIRMPMKAFAHVGLIENESCSSPINAFSWCPDSGSKIATCHDKRCIIWDIKNQTNSTIATSHNHEMNDGSDKEKSHDCLEVTEQNYNFEIPKAVNETVLKTENEIDMVQWLPRSHFYPIGLALNHKNCLEIIKCDTTL